MLFNSLEFAVFLPVVFVLYWFVAAGNLKLQNALIVISSLIFYGWWDWRFLSFIIFSSLVDYGVGLLLAREERPTKRTLLLLISVVTNLGLLGFFKYYNFFIDSFAEAFTLFGQHFPAERLALVLPVGISFYTFQTLSYSIDVYRRKLEPTSDLTSFMAFVCFFPQLVAGPIERATHLLPQFFVKRTFDYRKAVDGMRQILWGLFKKMVIADSCAKYVNLIFDNYENLSGSTLLLGAVFFSFQIYCDFSGYSDIAIGTARLFGFSLMRNFSFPYFSRDIAEFWRRWHISLSTWFRDYVYYPLGGSRGATLLTVRNTMIVFILSGFWHGANWTYVLWGVINALYFIPLLLLKRNRLNTSTVAEGKLLPSPVELCNILGTFFLTTLAWVFFRAESVTMAFEYLRRIFTGSLLSVPAFLPLGLLSLLFLFICVEWIQRSRQHALELDGVRAPKVLRWGIYYAIIMITVLYSGEQQQFIYFQF